MSATFPNSNLAPPVQDVIWSRGGGSFRRLLWKEVCDVAGLCGVFALGILIAALWARWEWVNRKEMFSLPVLLLQQIAGFVFPVIVGARAFAREFESGTWELLRSAGASAWNVWLSKLLVASLSSLGISMLSVLAISMSRSLGMSVGLLGPQGGWSALMLVLTVSMQCSLWLRRVWLAMVVSTALAMPLVYLTSYLATGWLQLHLQELHLQGLPSSEAVGLLVLSNIVLSAIVALFVMQLWTNQLWQLRGELFDHSAIHDSRRWKKVFGRVIWKELLAVRDFWLAVIGILIVLDGGAYWLFHDAPTRDAAFAGMRSDHVRTGTRRRNTGLVATHLGSGRCRVRGQVVGQSVEHRVADHFGARGNTIGRRAEQSLDR